jgi:hypothetical protein
VLVPGKGCRKEKKKKKDFNQEETLQVIFHFSPLPPPKTTHMRFPLFLEQQEPSTQ